MKKNIILIIAMLFFEMTVNAQSNTNSVYLLQGEVGTSVTLGINNSSGSGIGKQKIEILERYSEGDTSFYKYKNTITGMGTVKTKYTAKSYDNNSYIDLKDYLNVANFVKMGVTVIEPVWLIFPAELTVGQELVGYTMTRDYGSYKIFTKMINRKVEGFDTLSTPAGNIECVKFSYTIEATTNYGVFVSNYIDWYNKDLGIIRQESYTKTGRMENSFILESFDVKK